MVGFFRVSNILGINRTTYRPVPTQEPVELDTFAAGHANDRSTSASSATGLRLQMWPLPHLSAASSVRHVESLQPVRHRVGMSSTLTSIGCFGGALLGATGATAVAVNAYLNLKSTDPVLPFNPHGGNHKQAADALLAATASLVIPIGGGLAGAAIGGLSAAILGCCCY